MERKIITLRGLKKVLTPKELKNILGGSAGSCGCNSGVYGSYCESNSGNTIVCCTMEMSQCYQVALSIWGAECHTCGHCS